MELIAVLLVLAVIGLALWWPRSERELAERERALQAWRQSHSVSGSPTPPPQAGPDPEAAGPASPSDRGPPS